MSAMQKSIIVIVAVLAVAAPVAQAARTLNAKARDWGETGDSNGYDVLASARHFEGGRGTPKRAVTPEAAESTSNNKFLGLYRRSMDGEKASVPFATVEADPQLNPTRAKQTVQTRARAAIDTVTSKPVDQISGNAMVPTVAMGSTAVAQTYEGSLAVAASDAINVNAKSLNGKPTTRANSMITSYAAEVPRASRAASYGLTAQNTGAIALAGPADGNMVVAQAHETAAVAQASGSSYDQWQSDPRDSVGRKAGN